MECITKGYDDARLKNLMRGGVSKTEYEQDPVEWCFRPTYCGIFPAQMVNFDVLPRNISVVMEERWWMRRRSVLE